MTKIVYAVLMVLVLSGCTAIVDTYTELSGEAPVSSTDDVTDTAADAGAADSGILNKTYGN